MQAIQISKGNGFIPPKQSSLRSARKEQLNDSKKAQIDMQVFKLLKQIKLELKSEIQFLHDKLNSLKHALVLTAEKNYDKFGLGFNSVQEFVQLIFGEDIKNEFDTHDLKSALINDDEKLQKNTDMQKNSSQPDLTPSLMLNSNQVYLNDNYYQKQINQESYHNDLKSPVMQEPSDTNQPLILSQNQYLQDKKIIQNKKVSGNRNQQLPITTLISGKSSSVKFKEGSYTVPISRISPRVSKDFNKNQLDKQTSKNDKDDFIVLKGYQKYKKQDSENLSKHLVQQVGSVDALNISQFGTFGGQALKRMKESDVVLLASYRGDSVGQDILNTEGIPSISGSEVGNREDISGFARETSSLNNLKDHIKMLSKDQEPIFKNHINSGHDSLSENQGLSNQSSLSQNDAVQQFDFDEMMDQKQYLNNQSLINSNEYKNAGNRISHRGRKGRGGGGKDDQSSENEDDGGFLSEEVDERRSFTPQPVHGLVSSQLGIRQQQRTPAMQRQDGLIHMRIGSGGINILQKFDECDGEDGGSKGSAEYEDMSINMNNFALNNASMNISKLSKLNNVVNHSTFLPATDQKQKRLQTAHKNNPSIMTAQLNLAKSGSASAFALHRPPPNLHLINSGNNSMTSHVQNHNNFVQGGNHIGQTNIFNYANYGGQIGASSAIVGNAQGFLNDITINNFGAHSQVFVNEQGLSSPKVTNKLISKNIPSKGGQSMIVNGIQIQKLNLQKLSQAKGTPLTARTTFEEQRNNQQQPSIDKGFNIDHPKTRIMSQNRVETKRESHINSIEQNDFQIKGQSFDSKDRPIIVYGQNNNGGGVNQIYKSPMRNQGGNQSQPRSVYTDNQTNNQNGFAQVFLQNIRELSGGRSVTSLNKPNIISGIQNPQFQQNLNPQRLNSQDKNQSQIAQSLRSVPGSQMGLMTSIKNKHTPTVCINPNNRQKIDVDLSMIGKKAQNVPNSFNHRTIKQNQNSQLIQADPHRDVSKSFKQNFQAIMANKGSKCKCMENLNEQEDLDDALNIFTRNDLLIENDFDEISMGSAGSNTENSGLSRQDISEKQKKKTKKSKTEKIYCGSFCKKMRAQDQKKIILECLRLEIYEQETGQVKIEYKDGEIQIFELKASANKLKRYLIDAKWWSKWCDFCNFDQNDILLYQLALQSKGENEEPNYLSTMSNRRFESNNLNNMYHRPGRIENESLLQHRNYQSGFGGSGIDQKVSSIRGLKDNLFEHYDFEALFPSIWAHLYSWYSADTQIVRYLKLDTLHQQDNPSLITSMNSAIIKQALSSTGPQGEQIRAQLRRMELDLYPENLNPTFLKNQYVYYDEFKPETKNDEKRTQSTIQIKGGSLNEKLQKTFDIQEQEIGSVSALTKLLSFGRASNLSSLQIRKDAEQNDQTKQTMDQSDYVRRNSQSFKTLKTSFVKPDLNKKNNLVNTRGQSQKKGIPNSKNESLGQKIFSLFGQN